MFESPDNNCAMNVRRSSEVRLSFQGMGAFSNSKNWTATHVLDLSCNPSYRAIQSDTAS